MKVIVTYKKFHNIERCEIMPEVFYVKENEMAADALRRIWEDKYNGLIAERLFHDDDVYFLHYLQLKHVHAHLLHVFLEYFHLLINFPLSVHHMKLQECY